MNEKYNGLQNLIDVLCQNRKYHICIHDIEGHLSANEMQLDYKNRIHSKKFCDIAKSTAKGYSLCIHCKTCANKKAVDEKNGFQGYCPYGLYEIVKPIVIDGNTAGIIYIGNIVKNLHITLEKLHYAATLTGVDEKLLADELINAEYAEKTDMYESIGGIVDSYIRLLSEKVTIGTQNKKSGCKYKVDQLREYINYNYNKNIELKRIAGMYFINEKYLGRLFKREMGYTMHQYLNKVRLEHSADMLNHSDGNIIDIAYECGFENVTYFNRKFMQMYGVSPTTYRKGGKNSL